MLARFGADRPRIACNRASPNQCLFRIVACTVLTAEEQREAALGIIDADLRRHSKGPTGMDVTRSRHPGDRCGIDLGGLVWSEQQSSPNSRGPGLSNYAFESVAMPPRNEIFGTHLGSQQGQGGSASPPAAYPLPPLPQSIPARRSRLLRLYEEYVPPSLPLWRGCGSPRQSD